MREFGPLLPREQLGELGLRHVGDAGENVAEPRLRIDAVEFCGLNERVHEGCSFRPALGPGEQP